MTIELEQVTDTGDDVTGGEGEGESPGESESEQLATAERLDAELRGSLAGGGDEPPTESQSDDQDDAAAGGDDGAAGDGADTAGDAAAEPADDGKKGKKGNRTGWKWRGLEEQKKRIAQQQAELQAGYQTLVEREAAAKEYQEAAAKIRELAATSPRAAAREFARLTGQRADDLYQGWTEERLRGGTEAEHDKLSQVPPAVRQLLDEQAEQIRQLKEGHEKYTTTQQEQAAAAAHQRDCGAVLESALAQDDEKCPVLPYLATMPEAVRADSISGGVAMAIQLQQEDRVPRTAPWLAKRLDEVRRKELQDQLSALPVSALQAILPAGLSVVKGGTAEGSASSAGGASGRTLGLKRGGKRSPGNRAGAQSSTGARPQQSRAERERDLDERLRASVSRD
jgi:hypothetical protein